MVFERSELFLTTAIILFFLLTITFLILLAVSRLKKIARLKKQAGYDILAGNFMLSIIFENTSYSELSLEKEYAWVIQDKFFRSRLLDAVIKLHRTYTGEFAKKIETFYYESSLINDSYKKLRFGQWSVQCEAIRELAEMNVTSSYSLIAQYVNAPNLTLRQEAITAIIKLIGLKGLSFLNDYEELLTDWIQLNLISIIKYHFPTTDEPYYNSFIDSPNKSVALFGRRLKSFYEHDNESFIERGELSQIDYKTVESENPILAFIKREKGLITSKLITSFSFAIKWVTCLSIATFVCFLSTHLFEIAGNKMPMISGILFYAVLNDAYLTLLLAIIMLPVAMFLFLLNKKLMDIGIGLFYFLVLLIHFGLSAYFFKAKVPLGRDLLAYSMDEIILTAKAGGGLSFSIAICFLLLIAVFIFLMYVANRSSDLLFRHWKVSLTLTGVLSISSYFLRKEKINTKTEFENYTMLNKSYFFVDNVLDEYRSEELPFKDKRNYYLALDEAEKPIDPAYPFYKQISGLNTLRPFFKPITSEKKPDLVFILLEGMGSDFIGDRAKLGNFSPFLDSLSKKSLFWENALSAGGRTFAALPSVFGSLPFLKQGYLEEGEQAPRANSLFNILHCNGYHSAYYTGSNAAFDKMDIFLKAQGAKIALDVNNFGTPYTKLPSLNGFSWGYGDKDIFKKYFNMQKDPSPNVSVLFTVANHSPYLIPDQQVYIEKVKARIKAVSIGEDRKEFLGSYLNELSCLLYADDALRYFFNTYSRLPEFRNTIFIITGDHRAPEIPISFQIDRFRVPLIIYSPLLTRTANFKSVVTHFDITPSLLALFSEAIEAPSTNSWLGTCLDTSRTVTFNRHVALMRNKNEFQDYLSKDYLLSGNTLYQLTDDLGLIAVENEQKKRQLKEEFSIFKSKNNEVVSTKKLIPDSVLSCDTYRK